MSELTSKCPHCGSTNVEHMTRVTGFFSKVAGWNKGKVAELRDRRNAIAGNIRGLGGKDDKVL